MEPTPKNKFGDLALTIASLVILSGAVGVGYKTITANKTPEPETIVLTAPEPVEVAPAEVQAKPKETEGDDNYAAAQESITVWTAEFEKKKETTPESQAEPTTPAVVEAPVQTAPVANVKPIAPITIQTVADKVQLPEQQTTINTETQEEINQLWERQTWGLQPHVSAEERARATSVLDNPLDK